MAVRPSPGPPSLLVLTLAVVATGFAAFVLIAMNDVIPDRVQVLVLAIPIAAVTWWFGIRIGLVAVAVGAVAAAFLLVPPIGMWVAPNTGDLIAAAIFTVVALAIVAIIGQLRRSRERLAIQNRVLADTVAEKSRLEAVRDGFGAMLAHELRTPLTVILGDARLLLMATATDNDRQRATELVADIEQEATRLHRLLEDLLVVSHGVHELQVTVEPVMLQRIFTTLATEARRRNPRLRLTIDAPGDLPAVDADPVLCEQILGNLISNAVKYAGAAAAVTVTATADGDFVAIRCEDDGPGFPPAAITHVFDPFYRVPGSDRLAPGAGVGLYVVRQLVAAMHGQVEASNALPGRHAVVTVRLPAAADPDLGAPLNKVLRRQTFSDAAANPGPDVNRVERLERPIIGSDA